MTRKEWRAYSKHMKVLEKRDKEFHNLTIKELEDLTDWNWEKARRDEKSANTAFIVSIVFLVIGGVANVVAIVFKILTLLYR